VRDFKMVVDPGCMKCMDCVSVCPNDALSYGFAGPSRAGAIAAAGAAGRAPKAARRWDLDWNGEIAVAAVFLAAFLAFRGIYDRVPLLMAVGMALCTTFLAWTTWKLLRAPNVSIQNARLKSNGRLHAASVAWGASAAALFGLALQSGAVQLAHWNGERLDRRVTASTEDIFAGRFAAEGSPMRDTAHRAAHWYRRADSIGHGGWGLLETGEIPVRRAWLALVVGDVATAESHLRRVLVQHPGEIGARDGLARVLLLDGRADEAAHEWREAIRVAPTNASLHRGLADAFIRGGRLDDAVEELVIATNLDPDDAASKATLARLRAQIEREKVREARDGGGAPPVYP
jgi:tetratricopeptide (TPR) repeat protein